MAVYVDPMFECATNRDWRWTESCHMSADSLEELHEFARRIGLRRSWFQPHRLLPHYDLTASKRRDAVRLGAVESDTRSMIQRQRGGIDAPTNPMVPSPRSVARGGPEPTIDRLQERQINMSNAASLRPSDLQQGGLIDDIDVTFTSGIFEVYDYEGKADKPALVAHFTLTDDDGKEHEQYWSAGDPSFFMPSDNGLEAIPVGTRTGLSNQSNFAELLNSLVAAGFPEDQMTSSLECFFGMRAHVNRKPQPKRGGLINRGGEEQGEKTVLVVTKIHSLPWDTPVKKGPAKGIKPGAKAAPGKPSVAKATPPTKPAPPAKPAPTAKKPAPKAPESEEEGVETGGELDMKIAGYLQMMLEEAGGSLKKGALSPRLHRAMKDDPDGRAEAIKRIFDDEFLTWGAEQDFWNYDGSEVTSA